MYAWCSFGLTTAVFGYYLITLFGLPSELENYRENIIVVIWKVVGIAFLIEFVLDLLNSTKIGGVVADERDKLIESKAFRNAYYFLMAAIISLIINVLITDAVSQASGEELFLDLPFMMFHVLVFVLFIAILLKSGTQIFYYHWKD